MKLLSILLLSSTAFAQTVTFTLAGPLTALPGATVSATLTASGGATYAVAMQWTVGFPPGVTTNPIVGGINAGKTLSCAADFSTCLLSALDVLPMVNGAVAQFFFRIPTAQPPGPVSFPLSGLIAVGVSGIAPNVAVVALPVASGALYTITVQALKQDLNGDGKVDLTDVQLMTAEAIASVTDPTACKHDQNGDGKCNISDVVVVVLKVLGAG